MRYKTGEGWLLLTCPTCSQTFNAPRYQVLRYGRRYCSRYCAANDATHHPPFAPIDEVIRLYNEVRLSMQSIGERYGVSIQTVAYLLDKAGIERRKPTGEIFNRAETRCKSIINHSRGPRHPQYRNIPIDEIKLAYEAGASTNALAHKYGVSATTIARKLTESGVIVRSSGFGHIIVCSDGHIVQSFWEQLVDNWLVTNSVEHACHPILPFGRNMKADFYANGFYIELWGVTNNARYNQRRQEKLTLYQVYGLRMIEIWSSQIQHRDYRSLFPILDPERQHTLSAMLMFQPTKPNPRPCLFCGRDFIPQKANPERQMGIYCSSACYHEQRRQKLKRLKIAGQ